MQSLAESSHINAELFKRVLKIFVEIQEPAHTDTPIDQTFPIMGDLATFSNHF